MKKVHFFYFVALAFIIGLFASCERYDMATININKLSFNDTTRQVYYTAQVTDDGGCPHCIEAGYCFSYIDTVPSHTKYYSTVVPVIHDSLMTLSDSTNSFLEFSWERNLPFIETGDSTIVDTLLYYFRSYITTNAGTSYSDVDVVKVPRIY